MTGNLGKFSTEPAADGWRDKDEKARERMRAMRQSKIEREKRERGRERYIEKKKARQETRGGRWTSAECKDVRRLPDTAVVRPREHGSKKKWVARL